MPVVAVTVSAHRVWHNLGDAQMRLNLWEEAEVSFGKALELDHYLEAARTKQAVVRDRLKRRKASSSAHPKR